MPPLVSIFPSLEAYLERLESRTLSQEDNLEAQVRQVLERVRVEGDRALLDYTQRFDGVAPVSLKVGEELMEAALSGLDPALKDVWIEALDNIERFHMRQCEDSRLEFFPDGSVMGWKVSPLDRVGVYVPGGQATYASSLLMGVVPAQLAGVGEIVVVSPPGADGLPHRDILAAAALLGVENLYAVGGAQAIAALAWGTESVPRVDKIVGPGSRWVAEAKRQVCGDVGIDAIAGPSEIVILCTQKDIPIEYLARDLLSQAEHDADARALLVTTHPQQAQDVERRLEELIAGLPRADIIAASFASGSGIVLVDSLEAGLQVVNELAPEHLELLTADPFQTLSQVRHAGAIFLGADTPEAVGDYFAGPNHILPTGGRARFSSPLGVGDFIKRSSVLRYSPERLQRDSEKIQRFAEAEQLFAHAESLRARTGKGASIQKAAGKKAGDDSGR